MKKVLSLLIAIVLIIGMLPITGLAIESLSDPIFFTWAWDANKIDSETVTVVSWSGSSNSSYRSSFIVYDLPEDFTYTSVKTEVIASFAINSAWLNNGTSQAPTAAIVMVDGDKVKEAYNMKSGTSATALLTEAKNEGVLLGTYKIGQYPRTSRIKNVNINSFFEKHPDVKSIGFYVTNLASDGYSGVVSGIASDMSDFEVNFNAYQNYANATVTMVDSEGNILDTLSVRNTIGSTISVPETIEKDNIIWVKDSKESLTLDELVSEITVTYHDDKADRERYVQIIESMVSELVSAPVTEKIDLPTDYTADDGFVIDIEWISSDESIVAADGTVYQGTDTQTAEIYANVWIGDYTSVETKTFTVTVEPINIDETDENLIYSENFSSCEDKRGSFDGEKELLDISLTDEFTVSMFLRVDDLSQGGTIFNINGVKCDVNNDMFSFNEGQWYHIAMTNSAFYADGEKVCDITPSVTGMESFIGAYTGKMDNFYVYKKAFSQSVIKSLGEENYDSPEIEIVSASVIEGLDSVMVRVASKGYEGTGAVAAFSDVESVRHSGYSEKEIVNGVNVFSVSVPDMGGALSQNNTSVLLWDSIDGMKPVTEKYTADRKYDFGFNYIHPDNHMLSNTFTLMGNKTGLYLTSGGLSQSRDNSKWTAPFRSGVNKDGYYSLINADGNIIDGNWTFIQIKGNTYKIKNHDTGEFLSYGVEDEWVLCITEYTDVSKAFASEGFMLLSPSERESIYSVTGQALWQSAARREKLIELISGDYYSLDGYAQAERLREMLSYYPAYQINRTVNKSTTGVEAGYALSSMTWTSYTDMDGYTKSGYTATVTYSYNEGDVTVDIYARSQNVVRNIAKGFSYMPYQFVKPLKKVIDYNASNNQFKAETGLIYIETNYEVSAENVAVTGAHELGHLIDFAGFRMSMGDYKTARDNECSVSGYGNTALNEDFAEFCQLVISCSGDDEQLRQVRSMYPGRYNALCDGMCEMYGECILK